MDNPLVAPIEQTLTVDPGVRWSEHGLIRRLVEEGYLTENFGHDSLALFQTHFLVMNALYQLRRRFSAARQGQLIISALTIVFTPSGPGEQNIGAGDGGGETTQALAESGARLEAYYLSWDNFAAASTASVEELLNSFWRRYVVQDDRHQALALMDLQEPVTMTQIKKRYREKAMAWHPDRGGTDARLAELNGALDVLKRYYGPQSL